MNRSLNISIGTGPHYVGGNITATATLSPYTAGLIYIWIDGEGNVLNSGIDLVNITIPINEGEFNRSIIVSVIDGDLAINASVSYVCEYSSTILPQPTIQSVKRKRSNLELHRWLSYMPKWSFANKSHLSSYAKLSDFSYLSLTDIASKPIIKSAINMTNAIDTIDYNRYNYQLPVHKSTKLVVSDVGVCENIGHSDYVSFDSYPITNCYITEGKIYSYEYEYNTDDSFQRFNLPIECFLYLTSYDNTEDDVTIVGLDKNGVLIKDKFKLHPRISHKSINKYKAVIGVYSRTSFNISTTSKSDSYITGYIDSKRIVDIDGNYFEPFFKQDELDPTVLNITKDNGIDIYKFRVNKTIDKFVVTENLDLFFVSDNTLYSAKMYLDVALNAGITPTYNNNDICQSVYDNVMDGEYIEIDINTKNIEKIGKYFSIKMNNGNNEIWFNKNGLETNTRELINVKECHNKIVIRKQKLNNLPYIFTVFVNEIKEVFQSGIIDNNIETYKICEDIYDIEVFDGHIYISSLKTASQKAAENNSHQYHSKLVNNNLEIIQSTSSNSTTFKLIPVRCCYSASNNSIIFPQKINIEEVLYE